jgi:hypothetical protein
MVPVEQNQERADGGWKEQQTVLGEAVWMQGTVTVSNPNTVVVIIVIAIQRSKVDVGRGFVDINISMRGSENAAAGKLLAPGG